MGRVGRHRMSCAILAQDWRFRSPPAHPAFAFSSYKCTLLGAGTAARPARTCAYYCRLLPSLLAPALLHPWDAYFPRAAESGPGTTWRARAPVHSLVVNFRTKNVHEIRFTFFVHAVASMLRPDLITAAAFDCILFA